MKGIAADLWQDKLLKELIYERVMLHIDLMELMEFEKELSDGIERAMRESGVTPVQQQTRAHEYLEEAWQRVEREWDGLHEEPASWDRCPLCEGPFECPDRELSWSAVD